MGLREDIQLGIEALFNALDNIPEDVRVIRFDDEAVYDPATGTYLPDAETITVSKVIMVAFSRKEVDGQRIHEGDMKMLVNQNINPTHDFIDPSVGFLPRIGDDVERFDLPITDLNPTGPVAVQRFAVVGVKEDPTHSIWIVHLREKGGVTYPV